LEASAENRQGHSQANRQGVQHQHRHIALGLLSTVWKYADRFLDVDLNSNPTRDAELLPIRRQSGPIISSHGRAYGSNSLSNAFRKVFRQLGMDGYSVHGLRKNAAVALAEVGCEPHEIMAITGHKTLAMVTHYMKRANQKRLADRAMEKWKAAPSG
jgi:integrase